MTSYMQSRRRGGKLLQCLPVTSNIAIGVSTLDELETYGLKRPSQVEDATKKELKNDTALSTAYRVRETVQRRFDAPRRKRAVAYSAYLSGLITDTLHGGVPPITLFCPVAGEATDGGLLLPHSSPLVTLDGETQTEARFALRETSVETGEIPVMFVIYHGISEDHAGSIMHDFNVHAHPVAERIVSAHNHNGALTSVVVRAIQELSLDLDLIQRHKPRPSKKQIASYQCLTAAAAGAALGRTVTESLNTNVMRLNNQPNGIDQEAVKPFVIHALKLAGEDKGIGLTSPIVWALAGGVFHDFGKLLSISEWLTMNAAFKSTKPTRGTKNPIGIKRLAAFTSIGITQAEGHA